MSERLQEDLVRLAHRGADVREFALGVARILARAVPFDGVCVLTMDPATLLPTGAMVENGPPTSTYPRLKEIEFRGEDFNAFRACPVGLPRGDSQLRHRRRPRPQRASRGHHGPEWVRRRAARGARRRPDDVGRAGVAARIGSPAVFARRRGAGGSGDATVAEGLRRAALLDHAATEPADGEDAAGVLVVAPNGSTTFTDEVAAAWIDELGGNGSVPPVVTAVASRARTMVAGPAHDGRIARARVRTASGRWLVVRASVLGDEPGAHVAVMIEPARPHELAPLVADAYGLTEREREVTQLVARGLPTDAIAARLHLSSWTVQDHLKAIFEKVGVAARGELVARMFFRQRAPQL